MLSHPITKKSREAVNSTGVLSIGKNLIKAKTQDKYLGDILNEGGLAQSMKETISDRYAKAFNSIREIGAVINDFKINAIGGLKAGLDIFEMVVVPSVLNNSDTWAGIERGSINRLEDLQNYMFKNLLLVPHSVPTPSLRSELGCLAMEERIECRKFNFICHGKSLKQSTLAIEIYELQRTFNFPGLVQECRKLISRYGLPNVIDEEVNLSKSHWKIIVKKKIREQSEENLVTQVGEYSKLREGPLAPMCKNLENPPPSN